MNENETPDDDQDTPDQAPADLAEAEEPPPDDQAEPLLPRASATYSPDDNKLRLYPTSRLSKEIYDRVKAAGFIWAAKQGLFVAPIWTPAREDLLIRLVGEIDDEDKSLVERAEERAERFEDYSEKREKEANQAHSQVERICDGIPLGQPILVGHHSERHARKHAEQIQNGMRKAVKLWSTSKYWTERAAGAISHAKYKELPGVRARRIKKLEAEVRKIERAEAKDAACLKVWETCNDLERARLICARTEAGWLPCVKHPTLNQYLHPSDVLPFEDRSDYAKEHYPLMTLEEVKARARIMYAPARSNRWLEHYKNRIAYERAMLAEAGGLVSDREKFQPGGKILRRGQWLVILKVNPQSVTVSGHWGTTVSFDEIKDYQAPTEEVAAAVKEAYKLSPLCNYPGEGFKHMTQAELDAEKCRKWSDFGKIMRIAETPLYGAHRVQKTRGDTGQWSTVGVFVTDKKTKYPPVPKAIDKSIFAPEREAPRPRPAPVVDEQDEKFRALAAQAKAGVKVVSAPQLFPTPPEIADQVVRLAGIEGGRVLEPSAGTGSLLDAIRRNGQLCEITAVEINSSLVAMLRARQPGLHFVHGMDFLATNGELGTFDRIVMNPPFKNGEDMKHVDHAFEKLKAGGRLVSIVAAGPRQRAKFEPIATAWIDLPAGSFAEEGTNVNAAIIVLDK
jgi:phospholipid N-methyltransferase